MTSELTFEITFHGPFLVGGRPPGDGFDIRVDRDSLIPGSSIKGRMRAEAKYVLGVRKEMVEEIFGEDKNNKPKNRQYTPGKWFFSDVSFCDEPEIQSSNRVAMDPDKPDTGLTDEHHLMFYEQCWAQKGTYTIELLEPVAEEQLQKHIAVLQAAACSITNLGAMRRRGHGWVTICPLSPELNENELVNSIESLRNA